jgi:hypothetical protein
MSARRSQSVKCPSYSRSHGSAKSLPAPPPSSIEEEPSEGEEISLEATKGVRFKKNLQSNKSRRPPFIKAMSVDYDDRKSSITSTW